MTINIKDLLGGFNFYSKHIEPEIEFRPLLPEQNDIREFMEQSEDDPVARLRREGL